MSAPGEAVTAAVVIIGNEILTGRIADRNLAYAAKRLSSAGIRLAEARVVPDEQAAIVAAVNALRSQNDYVFTCGGIGPTHDDITARAIAVACGRALERNKTAEARLLRFYSGREMEATESRLSMADMPTGAALIDNPVSSAPGFRVENVYVLAGVPKIMQAMLDGLLPHLRTGAVPVSQAVTCQLGESQLSDVLGAIEARYGGLEVGSYPYFNRQRFGVTVVVRGTDRDSVMAAAGEVAEAIRARGGEPTFADHVDLGLDDAGQAAPDS